jgi:hemoglobin-like flavoprotein
MTSRQKHLLRSTFPLVEANSAAVAAQFYDELFKLDPTIRGLFKSSMEVQGRKLMQALKFAIASLDHPHVLIPALQAMGQRHVRYGVRNDHYATVGAALLRTLGKGLGKSFTPEVRTAWANVYCFIANTMKAAAAELELETEVAMAAR